MVRAASCPAQPRRRWFACRPGRSGVRRRGRRRHGRALRSTVRPCEGRVRGARFGWGCGGSRRQRQHGCERAGESGARPARSPTRRRDRSVAGCVVPPRIGTRASRGGEGRGSEGRGGEGIAAAGVGARVGGHAPGVTRRPPNGSRRGGALRACSAARGGPAARRCSTARACPHTSRPRRPRSGGSTCARRSRGCRPTPARSGGCRRRCP